ncbi:UBP-type domain-containing protein [Entamoeba marina]
MYCPLSLDTKLLETLYVCLNDGQSFCSNCLKKHQTVSSHTHYLVLHQLPSDEPEDPNIGYVIQITLMKKISLETITSPLKEYVNHFISCTAVERKVEMSNQRTSDYTKEIHQIERKTPIDMQHLQCEVEGCGITDNLWLNLIDGSVLCGREQSLVNGNSHALKHYDSTHLPLVVKLGTISSDGTADIYDYENDRDVTDPLLKQHLAFLVLIYQL